MTEVIFHDFGGGPTRPRSFTPLSTSRTSGARARLGGKPEVSPIAPGLNISSWRVAVGPGGSSTTPSVAPRLSSGQQPRHCSQGERTQGAVDEGLSGPEGALATLGSRFSLGSGSLKGRGEVPQGVALLPYLWTCQLPGNPEGLQTQSLPPFWPHKGLCPNLRPSLCPINVRREGTGGARGRVRK